MNQVERVKQICKDRKISLHKLEMDCKFGNGYIAQLKKGTFPADRLMTISNYLNVPVELLMNGNGNNVFATVAPAQRDHIKLKMTKSNIGMMPNPKRDTENAYISCGPIIQSVKSGRKFRLEVRKPESSSRTQEIAKIIAALDDEEQEMMLQLARRLKDKHQ